MKRSVTVLGLMVIASLLLNLAVFPLQNSVATMAASRPVVDDFETGLPIGYDGNGIQIGFFAAQDSNSTVAFSTTLTPPEPVPGALDPNSVLKMDFNVAAWARLIHGFENAALDTWVSQDWSAYGGISFWLYGNNSGTDLFVDVIDNRNSPPHTNDDAERFSITFKDNFSGWKQIELPFASFTRRKRLATAPRTMALP